MNPSFEDKTVIITGASRGIGLGLAKGFACQGARVHIIADDENVYDAAEAIGAQGYRADIANEVEVGNALSRAAYIDVLVNNAGYERMT
ncbi:SDR family NAD(P)-dependent oxidoreductase [Rhizobium lentis]|uniref:SDR family NAD(P)-dependent oxidoreductase n=1 Tax=Rhizobium lentis TaxID=1138194 RepID=UPI00287F789E|nr:SDR family NAD(P)-dependent oxidoreductase [Rhizobium lentis]